MTSDLHRPLGHNKPKSKKGTTPSVSRENWLTVFAVVIILSGSTYSALREDPLLMASSTVSTSNLQQTDTANQNDIEIVENPKIDQNGQSAASGNIETTLTEDGLKVTTVKPSNGESGSQATNIGQNLRMAHLPDERIVEDTALGPLPVLGQYGERAFDIYARPWSGARGVRVAIVVGGLGLSQTGSNYAIKELPETITLAFASNGNSLQRWMQGARRKGHEILLQVPLEPLDYPNNNPGRGTLEVALNPSDNLELLHEAMGRITNYTGIGNFMGARFLSDTSALEPIMRDIADRGLMFFDDGTTASSKSESLANAINIPFAASDIILDTTVEQEAILKRLDDLERIARADGQAIGVASASQDSIDAIRLWSVEAKSRGIEIVSLSALATDPGRR